MRNLESKSGELTGIVSNTVGQSVWVKKPVGYTVGQTKEGEWTVLTEFPCTDDVIRISGAGRNFEDAFQQYKNKLVFTCLALLNQPFSNLTSEGLEARSILEHYFAI